MKSKTTNGIGYHVEIYTRQLGWQPASNQHTTELLAKGLLEALAKTVPRENLRVYESLEGYCNEI